MTDPPVSPQNEDSETLRALGREGEEALGRFFEKDRARLRRMVVLRMDRRARGRIDPSDVIQEAYLDAARRLDDYIESPDMPLFLWIRYLTGQKLLQLHRRHLGVRARDARREVALLPRQFPEASSAVVAEHLIAERTSPSQAAIRAEMKLRLEDALNAMDPPDREVLVLRHFEQLSNIETAQLLELTESAASKRYLRALERLRKILVEVGLA